MAETAVVLGVARVLDVARVMDVGREEDVADLLANQAWQVPATVISLSFP